LFSLGEFAFADGFTPGLDDGAGGQGGEDNGGEKKASDHVQNESRGLAKIHHQLRVTGVGVDFTMEGVAVKHAHDDLCRGVNDGAFLQMATDDGAIFVCNGEMQMRAAEAGDGAGERDDFQRTTDFGEAVTVGKTERSKAEGTHASQHTGGAPALLPSETVEPLLEIISGV